MVWVTLLFETRESMRYQSLGLVALCHLPSIALWLCHLPCGKPLAFRALPREV